MKSVIQTLIAIIFLLQISYAQDFGLALSFDGLDDYGIVPHNDILNPGNSSWTMTCWIKAANIDQSSPIVMKRLGEDPYTQYSYGFAAGDPHDPQPGKRIRVNHIESAGLTERSGYTNDEFIDGQWHHISIVANKAQDKVEIFVDGSEVDFFPMYYFGDWPDIQTETDLYISRSNSSWLEAPLDELILWNRALEVEVIGMLMENPLPETYYETADSGVVAYYKFEAFEDLGIGTVGNNDIRDMSSYGNHMGTEGGPLLVPSVSLSDLGEPSSGSFELNVYPNPCSGTLNLRYSTLDTRYSILEVIDISGRVVKAAELNNQTSGENLQTVDVSDLPAGMYFIKVVNGNNTHAQKLFIQ